MLCQGILPLRGCPLQLSFGTVRGLASDTRSFDKTFSRTADSTLTAMESSFNNSFPAAPAQMIGFREFNSRVPDLTLCFRAALLSKARWRSCVALASRLRGGR